MAYRDGHPRGQMVPLHDPGKIVIEVLWGLITLAIILGGILGGVFTAIEAKAVACVSSVGCVVALTQMPAKMTALFLAIANDKNVILFLINILLLVFGCLIDMAPSILICTPILLPVMVNFGVDPVHFGMIMLLNLGIGGCHPPVGASCSSAVRSSWC
jgi:TRAP-type C4-dicarboxylate transport system permease large subunit